MNFKIRKIGGAVLAAALVTAFVITGCGGSKGGSTADTTASAGNTGTTGTLASVVKPVLQPATVYTTNLTRKDTTAIASASSSYIAKKTSAAGFGDAYLTVSNALTSDINGDFTTALPTDTYIQTLSGAALNESTVVPIKNAVVGHLAPVRLPVTVSGTAPISKNLRSEEYQWTITTPNPATSVSVTIVQLDSTGKPDYGTLKTFAAPFGGANYNVLDAQDPVVLSVSKLPAGTTTVQINTELLPGTYKAVIQAVAAAGAAPIATYVSPEFTANATTAGTVTNKSVSMETGKAVSVTLLDTGGAVMAGRSVDFYDGTSWILLGTAAVDGAGTATIGVATNTTSVIAQVYNPTTFVTDTVYVFSNLAATSSITLQQQTISGSVAPNTTCTLATTPATIGTVMAVPANPAILPVLDFVTVPTYPVSATTNGSFNAIAFGPTTGTGIPYTLKSTSGVLGCPDVTPAPVTVANAPVTQNLNAAAGGMVVGKISTKAGGALSGITVDLWQSTATGYQLFTSATTDVNGNYTAQVPYGTYMIWADGSVSEGIVVSATAASQTKNLTQYSFNIQVSKASGTSTQASTSPTVYVGTKAVAANAFGVASVKVMEGKTWFCVKPGATEIAYGYLCNLNVQVDAAAITAAGL